jgi:hypothetical protein
MPRYPQYYPALFMHGMTVCNQEHLMCCGLYQLTQKLQKHLCIELSIHHHKDQFTGIGNSSNHIYAKALATSWNHRRFPFRCISGTCLVLRTDACLIEPEDSPMLPLSFPPDSRILLLQPSSHIAGILLVSPKGGFLWCKIPVAQQLADVANTIDYPGFFLINSRTALAVHK